jgi:phage N-6-adenine-methyltransferase
MSELKLIDDRSEPDEDSYETPPHLYSTLCSTYGVRPQLDAAAKDYNTKCLNYLTDALHQEWTVNGRVVDVWCNPPHSLNEEFVRRADAQHKKHGITILMIIPTNCQSAQFWHEVIENESEIFVENHPVLGRPRFRKLGRKTKEISRNAYRVVIWRKK